MIDAKEVSAAHRARYFWGNLPGMNRLVRFLAWGDMRGMGGGAADRTDCPRRETLECVQPGLPLLKDCCSDVLVLLF